MQQAANKQQIFCPPGNPGFVLSNAVDEATLQHHTGIIVQNNYSESSFEFLPVHHFFKGFMIFINISYRQVQAIAHVDL